MTGKEVMEMPTENSSEQIELEREERDYARRFVLDNIVAGSEPEDILDGLTSFYDGDPCDLF